MWSAALYPGGHRITEWLRLEMISVGHLVQALCSRRNTQKRLSRTIYRCFLKISEWGDSTVSLGNLCQCSNTCTVQDCFLLFRWNLFCSNLCLLHSALSLGNIQKSLAFLLFIALYSTFPCKKQKKNTITNTSHKISR